MTGRRLIFRSGGMLKFGAKGIRVRPKRAKKMQGVLRHGSLKIWTALSLKQSPFCEANVLPEKTMYLDVINPLAEQPLLLDSPRHLKVARNKQIKRRKI